MAARKRNPSMVRMAEQVGREAIAAIEGDLQPGDEAQIQNGKANKP